MQWPVWWGDWPDWICDLFGLEAFICQIIGGSTVFLARILAVKYSICLPILKGEQR